MYTVQSLVLSGQLQLYALDPILQTPLKGSHLQYCRHFTWPWMHLHVLMFVNNKSPWIVETHKMRKLSYSTWTVQCSRNDLWMLIYCFCKIVRHFVSRLGLGTRLCFAVNDSFTKREGKTNGYGRGTKWAWGGFTCNKYIRQHKVYQQMTFSHLCSLVWT